MSHLKLVFVALFSLLVIVVAVQNHEAFGKTVTFRLDLLFFEYETSPMSLYFVAVITFLVGVLLTGLLGITERFRLRKEIGALKRMAREKDKELSSLRNLPVTGESVSPAKSSGPSEPA